MRTSLSLRSIILISALIIIIFSCDSGVVTETEKEIVVNFPLITVPRAFFKGLI